MKKQPTLDQFIYKIIAGILRDKTINYFEGMYVVHGGIVIEIFIHKIMKKIRIDVKNSGVTDVELVKYLVGKIQPKLRKIMEELEIQLSPGLIISQFFPQPSLVRIFGEEEYDE